MTFLFWNLARKQLADLLQKLVAAHAPDVILLAESPAAGELASLVATLNAAGTNLYRPLVSPTRRLVGLFRLPGGNFESLLTAAQSAAVSDKAVIYRVQPLVGEELLVVGLHLPSKLHAHDVTQRALATRLRPLIEHWEARQGHERTVVLGDLNMDPFEEGVVGSEGLHAIMDRATIMRRHGQRQVQGAVRRFFYNPMWSRLGDGPAGPAGTYYYAATAASAYYWHTFDQVLLRPALLERFRPENLRVLTSAGNTPLIKPGDPLGWPWQQRASDHFPLLLTL